MMTETFKSGRDVIVRAKDLAEATKFYTSVLGFRMTSKDANLAGFETGSFCFYVERGPQGLHADYNIPALSLEGMPLTKFEYDPATGAIT